MSSSNTLLTFLLLASCTQPAPTPAVNPVPVPLDACEFPSDPAVPCGLPPPVPPAPH